ncbi:hypothetical protein OSB04_031401 [Centaurea solstitialis]|uniref:DUF8040 domain-containing protein n=1 Tax=Centaurea solstitialis TaxID=347529 RepID=A0AA38SGY6_9ASTR|nr:hypothetical protein OSB04_031401 [Centaurea solstitialis]
MPLSSRQPPSLLVRAHISSPTTTGSSPSVVVSRWPSLIRRRPPLIRRTGITARLTLATRNRRQRQTSLILTWWNLVLHIVVVLLLMIFKKHRDRPHLKRFSSNVDRYPILHRHVYESDTMTMSQIRMSRRYFRKLCYMLETFGGLKPSRNMNIDEQVAIFLHILAHNVKIASSYVVFVVREKQLVGILLEFVMQPYDCILKPEPCPITLPIQDGNGALDGTYIKCLVSVEEKPRYKTRKNDIATNVLGVCSQDMQSLHCVRKDRARGNRARDFVEMEQEVNVEETQESDDDLLDSDNAASRNTNLQNDETSPSVISRKRKSRSDDGFNNAVGLITESLKEISKDLSQGIKFDMKMNELSEKIPLEIFKMTSLIQTEN